MTTRRGLWSFDSSSSFTRVMVTPAASQGREPCVRLTWDDLHIGPLLGEGSFCSVFEIKLKKPLNPHDRTRQLQRSPENAAYALKCVSSSYGDNDKDNTYCPEALDLAIEAKILARLNHKNIIQLHGVKLTRRDVGGFFLVMDRLIDTLDQRLIRWRREAESETSSCYLWPSMQERRDQQNEHLMYRLESVAVAIARGMEYLHQQNVIHRDLKPHNVGWDSTGRVKIFDFGLAEDLTKDYATDTPRRASLLSSSSSLRVVGTTRYMAPEVAMLGKSHFASDVYSFSILLWEICTLVKPFKGMKSVDGFHKKVFCGKHRPPLKTIQSRTLRQLLQRGWDHSPRGRPNFEEIRAVLKSQGMMNPHHAVTPVTSLLKLMPQKCLRRSIPAAA